MLKTNYVISKNDNHKKQIFRMDGPGQQFTYNLMEAELFSDKNEALSVFFGLPVSQNNPYKLLKLKMELIELQLNCNEIPNEPIPRKLNWRAVSKPTELVGPKSKVLVRPPH